MGRGTKRIYLKEERELAAMRRAGALAADTLRTLRDAARPGVTTAALNQVADEWIRAHGGRPAFLGYRGFPASVCVSVNEQVVHGLPGERRLEEGDLVSLDVGVVVDGFHGDAAVTLPVGEVSPERRALLEATYRALRRGVEAARRGGRVGDISHAIQCWVEGRGYSVVRDLVGHGIGRRMHEEPPVPNAGEPGRGPVLVPGMTLAIEPMVSAGGGAVTVAADGWTVCTADGAPAAHFEHTIAIGREGTEILTRWPGDEEPIQAYA